MTRTNGAVADPIRAAIGRADHRYAKHIGDEDANPDYLDRLATAVRAVIGDQPTTTPASAPPADDRDLVHARAMATAATAERDQLAGELRAVRQELAEARADRDTTRAERDTTRARLAEVEAALAAAIHADTPTEHEHDHVHGYPVDVDTGDVGPCACGQPYPRTVLAEEMADAEPISPDRETWSELFARIRRELEVHGG